MYVTVIEVTGTGSFPLDMLRYDQAAPRDSEAIEAIHTSLDWRDRSPGQSFKAQLNVYHVAKTRPGITPARWASFGWACRTVSTTKVG